MTTIALIEDTPKDSDTYKKWLLAAEPSFRVVQAYDKESAVDAIAKEHFDIVIVDIELGYEKQAGFGVIAELIAKQRKVPVLVISGSQPEHHDLFRKLSRQLACHEYLPKPFDEKDFLATVLGILRDRPATTTPASDGELRIDPIATRIFWKGKHINFTRTQYRIVNLLYSNKGRTVQPHEFYKTAIPTGRDIASHILNVRKKFKDVDKQFNRIGTDMGGGGYFWKAQ